MVFKTSTYLDRNDDFGFPVRIPSAAPDPIVPTVGDDMALGEGEVVREVTVLGGAEEPGVAIGVGGGTFFL